MKLRKFILTLAASTITMNAFAINECVRTISEHTSITPGFSGGFYSITEKKTTSPNATDARVFVTSKSGKVNQFITVDASHSVYIINNSDKSQRYSYHYDLKCADGAANYDRTIEIPARGNFRNDSYSYVAIQKTQPGTWRIEGQTKINGAENGSANDSSTLTVYK